MAAIPLPPKKTIEEHAATQAEFLETKLEPLLEEARAGKGQVFFVDAAHFVMGAFLCCVWCWVRLLLRGASGRQRYSVLGAWNAVTQQLVSITTDATVSAETMCALLVKIAALGLQGPITLVLDNARYQHCALVMSSAKSLNIHPPSPAALLPPFAAGVLNQDAPHGLGRGSEEVFAVLPVILPGADQPQVGFVNEGRGLERLARSLLGELLRRELAQLLVDER